MTEVQNTKHQWPDSIARPSQSSVHVLTCSRPSLPQEGPAIERHGRWGWISRVESEVHPHLSCCLFLTVLIQGAKGKVGLLVNERMINCPMQAVPKLHEALAEDIAWAVENEVSVICVRLCVHCV